MIQKLNKIQSSIHSIWKRKPKGFSEYFINYLLTSTCRSYQFLFIYRNVLICYTGIERDRCVSYILTACKTGWKRYQDHCYYLYSTKINWFEAQVNSLHYDMYFKHGRVAYKFVKHALFPLLFLPIRFDISYGLWNYLIINFTYKLLYYKFYLRDSYLLLVANFWASVFSSPELKAQVSFSDHLSSVVCLSVRPSVCL